MSEDYGNYIDAPGEACSPSVIPHLQNVLQAAEAYYAFTGGDNFALGGSMHRIKLAIDALKEYHDYAEDSNIVR